MTREITIDARWLRTGIGRYTLSLLEGLKEHISDIAVTGIVQPRDVDRVSPLCDRVLTCNAQIYGLREQLALPWLAKEASALYAPHYNVPLLWQRRLLVTIHDLNHLLDTTYQKTWKSRLYARPLLTAAVRRADVIITPSAYTKAKLIEHLAVPAAKVRVIPCCVSPVFRQAQKGEARLRVANATGIGRPYLLFVGNCAPNKNVPLLLEAVSRLRGRRADTPLLVMAGSDCRWQPAMQRYARALGLGNGIAWVGKVDDALLTDLYAGAVMTVMPSFEEGFGLPVVESMACGTPVVCSEAASLPEVAGNAALFFSPHDCEQLVEVMQQVIDSPHTQQKLIYAGLLRARNFSQRRFSESQASAIHAVASIC